MIQIKKTFLALSLWSAMTLSAFAQGTAFTYQGQLNSGASPANGSYDVQFTLFSVSSGGGAVAGPLVKSGIGVTNGLFTTTVDFGSVFTGSSNWLELAVRTNGASSFSPPLTPRQQLTPTPYAVYAESANASNLVGTVASANLPADAALLDANQTFTGINNFSASVGLGTSTPATTLQVIGNVGIGSSVSTTAALSIGQTGAGSTQLELLKPGSDLGYQFYTDDTGLGICEHDIACGVFYLQNGTGNLGIGTAAPANKLDVQGSADFTGSVGIGTTTPNSDSQLQVKGMMRMGSETGTSEAPSKPIMLRRINSTSMAIGQVVARSLTAAAGVITLERDGTAGGLILKATGSAADAQIVGFGINTSNAVVTTQSLFYGGTSASYQVFTDAQKISYLRLSFGDAANPSDFTTVELMRAVDNFGNNGASWIGTVTSTVNQ